MLLFYQHTFFLDVVIVAFQMLQNKEYLNYVGGSFIFPDLLKPTDSTSRAVRVANRLNVRFIPADP